MQGDFREIVKVEMLDVVQQHDGDNGKSSEGIYHMKAIG